MYLSQQISVLSKSEIGFLKVIVRPLHVTLSKFLNDGLEELIENIDESIIEWEKKLSQAIEIEKELNKEKIVFKEQAKEDQDIVIEEKFEKVNYPLKFKSKDLKLNIDLS